MLLEIVLGIVIAAMLALAVWSIIAHRGCCGCCDKCAKHCYHKKHRHKND